MPGASGVRSFLSRIRLPGNVVTGCSRFSRNMDAPLNILVAEDNEDDLFLLRQAFKKAEVPSRLQATCDGLETLSYLKGEGRFCDRTIYPFPDVLLLDLNMPRKNGFEVLEWLRQDPRCCQLITYVLSASSRDADVQRAYDLRANSYILKPSRLDELVAFVTALHTWQNFVRSPSQALNRIENRTWAREIAGATRAGIQPGNSR